MIRSRVFPMLLALLLVAGACSVHSLDDDRAVLVDQSGNVVAPGAGAVPPDETIDPATTSDGGAGGDVTGTSAGSTTSGPESGTVATTPGDAPPRAPSVNPSTPEDEVRVASDQGVFPDEIHLGILNTDDGFYQAQGVDTKPFAEVVAPFIAEINANGGINGRKVVPKYSSYNPLDASSMNAACVEQAEDHKVFSSIAQIGYYGDAEICMATKSIPLLTGNNSTHKTNVERERGWVRQTNQNKDRNIKNWIDWMISSGLLTPSIKTGLIYVDVPEDRDLIYEVVLPYMDSLGLPEPEIATLSSNIAQTPAETQSAVLRFSSENVALVLPFISFLRILIFAEQASAANYFPEYSVSDFGLLSTDAMAGMPPAQWEGVKGITVLPTGLAEPGDLPPGPAFAECNRVYEQYGQTLAPHPDDPERKEGVEVAQMMHYCQHIALWADVALRAGTNPTRQTLLAAFDRTGTWNHRVTLSERLTYAPDKYDGADLFSVVRWESNCTSDGGCYRQVEGFRAGRW
ncbi:MAG TPA: hypothetical protein VGA13_10605 [Acidimicrobiales bacterium]